MRRFASYSAIVFFLTACGGASNPPVESARVEVQDESIDTKAERLAKEILIVDGHVDLPYRLRHLHDEGKAMPDLSAEDEEGNFDAVRAREGGLDAPFMSIYIPSKYQEEGGAKKLANELIDSVEEIVKKWPQQFALAASPETTLANFAEGKTSLLLGIENGAALEDDIKNVQHFFDRGVRYITLTHSTNNLIGDSSYDEKRKWNGLSEYGAKVIAEMNRVGIMIDVSHVSDETFYDVVRLSTKPVIASHSSMRHFTPGFERNMSDDMVRALAKNGGVVMINFGSGFISSDAVAWRKAYLKEAKAYRVQQGWEHSREVEGKAKKGVGGKTESASPLPTLEPAEEKRRKEKLSEHMDKWKTKNPYPFATASDVADHIERVINLVGANHVGFGSDFDGVGDSLPTGLKDASGYPNLFAELLRRGYSEEELRKISSGNLLRVWGAQNNSRLK